MRYVAFLTATALNVTVSVPPTGRRVPAFGLAVLTTSFWLFLCAGSICVTLVQFAFFSAAAVLLGESPTSFGTVHFAATSGTVSITVLVIVLPGSIVVVVGSTIVVVVPVGVVMGGVVVAAPAIAVRIPLS
jgi:hypothetical protein